MGKGNGVKTASKALSRMVCISCAALLVGCVAGKKATVHQSLKGDNSTKAAMQGEVELPESGFRTLSELTDRFAVDLGKKVSVHRVYLNRTNIRDANTRDVANFSTYLENELDASLSSAFQLVNDPAEADYLIGAVFQEYGNSIKIFFKYHNQAMTERKSLDYSIERLRLPADSLRENMRSKAYKLAANIVPMTGSMQLYINPVELGSCNCLTEFSRSFTARLKNEVVRLYPDVQVCDEIPIKREGLRGIKKKAEQVENIQTAEALFAGADTVLEGDYFINGEAVMVSLVLKDLDGRVLNTASVDIDRAMIHTRLKNPAKEKLVDKADATTEDSGEVINITTTKGSSDPVYRKGEKITFLVQAKRPKYVYLYDITSKGDVALLYPYEPGLPQQPLLPGRLQAIPDESDDFELEVTPPYGMDMVKVFASPIELPIPRLSGRIASKSYTRGVRAIAAKRKQVQQQLAGKSTINPDDLVDYYRGLADRFAIKVYEDSLLVETTP